MIYTPMVNKALKICFKAHKEDVDKAGVPYVFHPVHVAEQFNDELSIVCALLHDVVEDGHCTFAELAKMFPLKLITVLDALTRRNNETYRQYIIRLSQDEVAKSIKIEDLKHNMDLNRFSPSTVSVDKFDQEKAKGIIETRYKPALAFLKGENGNYEKYKD